jgi:hypothetical protein
MAENPYKPPTKGGDPSPLADEGIAFNDFDLERVSRATTWMRRVSSLQFVIGGLLLVLAAISAAMSLPALSASPAVLIGVVSAGAYAVLMLLGAVWLRGSCVAFYDGIMANAESGLALGFRKLRLYLVLYGVFGLLGLALLALALMR